MYTAVFETDSFSEHPIVIDTDGYELNESHNYPPQDHSCRAEEASGEMRSLSLMLQLSDAFTGNRITTDCSIECKIKTVSI